MRVKKIRKFLLVILLILPVIKSQRRKIKGCVNWNKVAKTCRHCYRRQVSTKGCGPLLPVTDECLVHAELPGQKLRCSLCRPGYILSKAEGNCVPGNTFNCLLGYLTSGSSQCVVCGNGQYPSIDGSQCSPQSSYHVSNCLWGGLRTRQCWRCGAGYALSFDSIQCIKKTTATIGCWQLDQDGRSCLLCDSPSGYSIQLNGKCEFIKE